MKNSFKLITVILIMNVSVFQGFAQSKGMSLLEKYDLGIEYQQDENYYLASQYYLEVVNENPAFTDAWYKLSECCYKLGEFDLALSYLENAEKYEKNNSTIQNLKGMIYVSLGKLEVAKTLFNDILKKYPNDIEAHFGLAEIELYEGRYSGAQNHLDTFSKYH